MQMISKTKSAKNCKKSLDWNESLPDNILSIWYKFACKLHFLNLRSIPRYVFSTLPEKSEFIEIHGFCDARKSVYRAVIFIRAESDGSVSTNLLCSKSRVAPIKPQTLPRLELCGALLLSELVSSVLSDLKSCCTINLVRLWTDSTVVLSCWLLKPPCSWKPYVANRVQQIQNLTSNFFWDHIRGKMNPADILSRGTDADTLISHKQWWTGPEFLSSSDLPWGTKIIFDTPEYNLPDGKTLKPLVALTFKKKI